MESADGIGPLVAFPERVDRRLRLGPFPSAREALKFLCYAAVGAVLAPTAGVVPGLAVAALGFLASVWRPDGVGWDDRVVALLRWRWRANAIAAPMSRAESTPAARRRWVSRGLGDVVAVVRTDGVPVAYLPPVELERRFAQFRDLLRATDGRIAFLATVASIRAVPFVPHAAPTPEPARQACEGYAELVRLLCRRRYGRRVYVALGSGGAGPDRGSRLEDRVGALVERLRAFGVHPLRLEDRALTEACHRFGWSS